MGIPPLNTFGAHKENLIDKLTQIDKELFSIIPITLAEAKKKLVDTLKGLDKLGSQIGNLSLPKQFERLQTNLYRRINELENNVAVLLEDFNKISTIKEGKRLLTIIDKISKASISDIQGVLDIGVKMEIFRIVSLDKRVNTMLKNCENLSAELKKFFRQLLEINLPIQTKEDIRNQARIILLGLDGEYDAEGKVIKGQEGLFEYLNITKIEIETIMRYLVGRFKATKSALEEMGIK